MLAGGDIDRQVHAIDWVVTFEDASSTVEYINFGSWTGDDEQLLAEGGDPTDFLIHEYRFSDCKVSAEFK